jgi:cystathionine beta-lyase
MTYNFDQAPPPHPDSAKARKYAGKDIIPLWVADMDFTSPPEVLDAILQRTRDGRLGYSLAPDSTRDALLENLHSRHHLSIDPDSIVWRPGTVVALHGIAKTLLAPGEEFLVLTPAYPPFLLAPPACGRAARAVPLTLHNHSWQIDFDALEAAVTPGKTKAIYLCHPHNPIARQWTQPEVEALDAFTQRHNLLAVWDELHCDLLLDPNAPHYSAGRLPEGAHRRILLLGPTKTYNIAGLGVAAAIIPDPDLRKQFTDHTFFDTPLVSPLAYAAAEAAYRHGEPWRQALLAYLRTNRDLLLDFTRTHLPGITIDAPIQATYLAWLNVQNLAKMLPASPATPNQSAIGTPQSAIPSPPSPATFFESHGIGLMPSDLFNPPASPTAPSPPAHLRLNFALPRQRLLEALTRMKSALASL